MSFAKWIVPILCVSSAALAQAAIDLNGLVSVAGQYVSSGMSGAHDPETLVLNKINGDMGSQFPDMLMSKASDVQHWTFLYRISPGLPTIPPTDPPSPSQPHTAVLAECTQGVFNSFHFSDSQITGLKSLQYTWVAASLDTAILNLNANGYVRGFSSVALMRPDLPNFPDEFVYVFNCPWERREVAISCQTGALAWTYGF
jgi:hypothetical protein